MQPAGSATTVSHDIALLSSCLNRTTRLKGSDDVPLSSNRAGQPPSGWQMADRHWGPTGVGPSGPGLNEETKEKLLTYAGSSKASRHDLDNFVGEIDKAVASYWGAKLIHTQSLPSEVRHNLKQALQADLLLNDKINDLDGLSRQLLYGYGAPDALQKIYRSIGEIIQRLNVAHQRAEHLQRTGGRPPDFAKLMLAAHVAYAIKKYLGIKPTTTREGFYEDILKVVVNAVDPRNSTSSLQERPEPSVRNLMQKALKVRVTEHEGGATEFDPWVD